jgi:hypothetical protein
LHHPRFRCHSSHLMWAWCLRQGHAVPLAASHTASVPPAPLSVPHAAPAPPPAPRATPPPPAS